MTPYLGGVPWMTLLPYLLALAGILLLVRLVPWVGRILRAALTLGLLALLVTMLVHRSAFDPFLAPLASKLRLDGQEVAGKEMRVRMAPDGHFWVRVDLNGVQRRMLVDSGATITAISLKTATAAGLDVDGPMMPVALNTANGTVQAGTATLPMMRIGNIVARRVPVVISPAFGDMDVLGMNFLSRLKSWRVEGDVLILTPHHPVAATASA